MESELDNPNPGLLGSIKNFYYSLEDKYYSFMDGLQDRGIPSYSAFVNPIENLKIPSFPVFAVLLLAILGAAILGVASLAGPTQTVTLSVNLESKGTPVEGLSVTLMDADKELQTIQTDSDGTAYFDSVPLKTGLQVKVEDANYNPVLEKLELSTEETNSLSLSLEPRGTFKATTQDFIVKVLDDAGTPIPGATVSFQELGTDQTNTIQTTTDGSAVIKLEDNNKLLKISVTADGYFQDDRSLKATDGQTEFKLQRKAEKTPDEGGTKNEKTSVSVKVVDEQGNAVPSTITLILQGSPAPLDAAKTESGTAIFDVDSGATVYATATADGYQNAQSEFITTDLNQINELTITLQNQTNTQTPTVQIKITNADSQPLENAEISLYSDNSNNYITSAQTDSDGLAELELSNQDAHYITAYLDGYLPLVATVTAGTSEFKLEQTTTANSANVDIEVINRKNEPQSGVQIDILDANGRFAGLPTQITGQAGIASFTALPVDVQMRARAMQDSVTKDSDVFILAAGDEDRKVQMQLPQATGKIKLNVTNLLDYSPIPGALIEAYEDTTSGEKMSKCTTTNNECTLEVYSNTQVILVTSAPGFEGFTSAPIVLSTNERMNKTILLMPSEFKNNIQIKLLSITDENGRDVTSQTQLSKAKTYTAHLEANFPTSQTQGIYLRLGDENTNAQDDTAAITNTEVTPNAIANPIITTSQTYTPNCQEETQQEEIDSSKLDKWTQVEYTGITGTVELTAQIRVAPSAKAGDKITLNYRSFARSATGKVARAPFDEDLQNEQNSTKGECQAKLLTKQYEATDGTFICNDAGSACIEATFQNLDDGQTFQTPYTAQLNKPFILNYKIKNFESLEPTSAYAKITAKGKQVQIQDFAGDGTPTFNTLKQAKTISLEGEDQFANVIKILLAEQKDEYNGAIKILPLVPSDYAQITIEFGDARGPIALYDKAYILTQGTGLMQITAITPNELEVGKAKDIKLKLTTAQGLPVTDATISIEEENGAPFNGDTPSSIIGDDSNELGQDGIYVFKRIKTQAPGTFKIIASKPKYRPTQAIITSTISNFFELSQPDLLQLSCSTNNTSQNLLKVKNTLDETINAEITIDPACATIKGPGVTPVQTALQQGQTQSDAVAKYRVVNWKSQKTIFMQLSPAKTGGEACTLEISAVDPRTNVRNKDTPLQIENTCAKTTTNASELKDAEAVIYINSNSFTPVRVVVDVFSYLRYGSYQPQSLWDSRYTDAASYQANPYGGQYAYANRVNQYAGLQQPYPQYGLTGAAPNTYLQKGSPIQIGSQNVDTSGRFYGTSAFADASGQNTFIDVARQNDKRNYTIAFVNEDEVPHALKCKNRNGDTILNVESIDAGSTYISTISKPGLYQCKLETGDTGTIKIKSMCPQKGALYYTRLITRCMARNALGETGLFDGGKQHAANIAASVNTRFVVYANKVSMGVVDDAKENAPKCKASSGEVSCQIKISPLIQQNGFAFSIEDATGEPNYRATYVQAESNVPLKQCTEIVNLDTESSYRALLSPVISAVSTTGLTTPSKYTSWAIKFNPTGDCVKVRPVGSSTTMQAQIYNPQEDKFVGNGQLTFDLVSQNNPNIKLRVKLEIIPQDSAIDGRFLFTTIPTTGSLYYRTATAPKEPGFIVNNLPGEKVALGVAADAKTQDIVPANTLAVLTGNAPNSPDHYNTITDFAKGYYLCTEKGGCNVKDGQAVQVKNFKLNPEDAKENEQITQVSSQLGDVIGNYKYDTSTSKEKTDAFKCSGTQYCSSESERKAVADANEQFAKAVKEQYAYVETINIDSAIENTGDALSGCIQEAMAEIVAQEAQYQLCKTLVNMCTGEGMFDPEEEEIEDGENFAGGLTLDAVLGDSQTIVKDIICQETEFGQNLQRLRDCLQPGNRQCRDLIASRIAGNLKQAKIKSVVSAVPVVDIKQPTVFFVTKRIQDVPSPDNTNLASEKHGGYNIYHFSYDEQQLLKQQASDELFRVDPPGYDLSKYIAATASAPSQLVKSIVDWSTNDAVPINKARADALAQETSGFPYTTPKGTVVFDQFKPTLLTINKYPIARAFSNVATEKETLYGDVEKTSNTCTINNRPADPLGLFDACEDLRGTAEQSEYDTQTPTEDKAPLSKSLVFLAVPNGIGETAGKPTWPLDWSEFKVTLTPQNELYAAGKTTRGVSAPYIAKIPVFGKALYPYAPSEEDLVIPKESAKDYAILVKGCKFTRDQNSEVILDAKRAQCDQTTSLEAIAPTYAAQCDAKSACAFITMQVDEKGRFLNVAALDGIDSHARGTNNVKIGEKEDEKTTIEELTRDLLRYYTDETYKAPLLTKALASKACTLQGNEKQAFLKCDKLQDAADSKLKIFIEKQKMATLTPEDDAKFQLKLNAANELNFPQLNEATITTIDAAGKTTTAPVEQIGSFVATFDTSLNQELKPKLILNTLGHSTPNADGTVTNLDAALFTKLTGLKDPAITTWDKLNGQTLLVMHVVYQKKDSRPAQIQLYSYDGKDKLTWFYTIKGQTQNKVITATQIRNILINAQTPQELKSGKTHKIEPTAPELQNGLTVSDALQEMTFFASPATTSIAIAFGEATKASKTEYDLVKDALILGAGITDNVLVVKGQFLPVGTKLRVKFFKKPKLTEEQRSCEPANSANVACYDATFDPQPDPDHPDVSVARLNLQGRKINVDYNFIRVILPNDTPDGENKFIDTTGTLTNPKAEFAAGDQNLYCEFNGKKVINPQCPKIQPKELKDLKKVPKTKATKPAATPAASPTSAPVQSTQTTMTDADANQVSQAQTVTASQKPPGFQDVSEGSYKSAALMTVKSIAMRDNDLQVALTSLEETDLQRINSVDLVNEDVSSKISLTKFPGSSGFYTVPINQFTNSLVESQQLYIRVNIAGYDYYYDGAHMTRPTARTNECSIINNPELGIQNCGLKLALNNADGKIWTA